MFEEVLQIRLTKEVKAVLKAEARERGLKLATYIRVILTEQATKLLLEQHINKAG